MAPWSLTGKTVGLRRPDPAQRADDLPRRVDPAQPAGKRPRRAGTQARTDGPVLDLVHFALHPRIESGAAHRTGQWDNRPATCCSACPMAKRRAAGG
jgi:hypothetical protein